MTALRRWIGLWFAAHYLDIALVTSLQVIAPTNVTVKPLTATSALVTWSLEDDALLGTVPVWSTPPSTVDVQLHPVTASQHNHHQQSAVQPNRFEITYKPVQERQRMVVVVPSDASSYVITDLRPGAVYSVTVTSITKSHRIRSHPVQLAMSAALADHVAASAIDELPIALPSMPSPVLMAEVDAAAAPPSSSQQPLSPAVVGNPYRSFMINRAMYGTNYSSYAGYYPPTLSGSGANAGVIYVRGEEVGIVVLVLIVWIAAVALFFHRWGKIRMLLPYQPVFKEEEPAIVGCSPSPTLQLAAGQQSQLIQQSSLGGQAQQNTSAVLVSTNKFVSLDPAAIRRTQFMERRHWPATSNRFDRCIIVGRSPALPSALRRQQAYAGRRANTIAAASPCGCGDSTREVCPHRHHLHRQRRLRRCLPGVPLESSECTECSCDDVPVQQSAPRKAHSAEVITLTVTSCDSPTSGQVDGAAASSSSSPDLREGLGTPLLFSSPTPSQIDFLQSQTAECTV